MTGAEMIVAFKIYFDRITSFSAPGYKDSQILLFLNNAQDQFIKDRTFGENFQPPAFEDNQKRVVDILPLTIRDSVVGTYVVASPLYGATAYSFNKNTIGGARGLYTLELEIKVTRTNPTVTNEYVQCDRIKSENVGRFMASATNRTHFINPKWIEDANNYFIICDSHTTGTDAVRINLVRRPYPILNTSTEYTGSYAAGIMNLHMSVHQEIVDIAVQQGLQSISDPRWQTKVGQKQIETQ